MPPVLAFWPNVMVELLNAPLKLLSPYHIPLFMFDGYGVFVVNSKLESMTGVPKTNVDQPLTPLTPVVSMHVCSLYVSRLPNTS